MTSRRTVDLLVSVYDRRQHLLVRLITGRVRDHQIAGSRREPSQRRYPVLRRLSRGNEYRLPGQLDLKLGAVILDLKFHF
jgi:hypothetical protein